MSQDYTTLAFALIEEHHFIALATVNLLGIPWSSTVYYVFDPATCSLFFRSGLQTKHMLNISTQSAVAGSIYGEQSLPGHHVAGVQISGTAIAIADGAEEQSVEALYALQLRSRSSTSQPQYSSETAKWKWARIQTDQIFYYDTRFTAHRSIRLPLMHLRKRRLAGGGEGTFVQGTAA